MSGDAWKDRAKAKEDEFFEKANQAAIKQLKERHVLKSPVSGEPMEQLTIMGVNVDRCHQSGGIWLDAGELEQIISTAKGDSAKGTHDSLTNFFSSLFKKA